MVIWESDINYRLKDRMDYDNVLTLVWKSKPRMGFAVKIKSKSAFLVRFQSLKK